MTTTSATSSPSAFGSTTPASAASVAGSSTLAGNFNTFLQLLTTQLQNQNPLDPLDTNQFTQQLVEFASVEQQVNMNGNLQTLIAMQQTQESTAALQLLGDSVTINTSSAPLSNSSPATWSLNSASPANATITITSSTGQVAFTGSTTLSAGSQTYSWNGQGNNGVTWPAGNYTMSISATGANGQSVSVTSQVQGTVSAIDVSQFPPMITVNGQSYSMNQIESIATAASASSGGVVGNTVNAVSNAASAVNNGINSLLSKL